MTAAAAAEGRGRDARGFALGETVSERLQARVRFKAATDVPAMGLSVVTPAAWVRTVALVGRRTGEWDKMCRQYLLLGMLFGTLSYDGRFYPLVHLVTQVLVLMAFGCDWLTCPVLWPFVLAVNVAELAAILKLARFVRFGEPLAYLLMNGGQLAMSLYFTLVVFVGEEALLPATPVAAGMCVTAGTIGFAVVKAIVILRSPVEACVRAEGDSFLKRFFGGAAKPLLVHFAQNSKLTPEEVKKLREAAAAGPRDDADDNAPRRRPGRGPGGPKRAPMRGNRPPAATGSRCAVARGQAGPAYPAPSAGANAASASVPAPPGPPAALPA